MQRKLWGVILVAAVAAIAGLLLKRRGRIILPRDLPDGVRDEKRRISFRGARNTRDLGGYVTRDGRSVKWGVLYRSGGLNKLTKRDKDHFGDLALAKLVDLRSVSEREEAPYDFPTLSSIEIVNLPIEDANFSNTRELQELIMNGDISAIDPDALLGTTYQQFVTEHTPCYRQLFAELLNAAGKPVMFNCTAGKDRTGFAAALLLRILGVPEETIMKDYLMTAHYAAEERKWQIAFVRMARGKAAEQVVRQLLGVKPGYLEAAFAAIEQEYASFENYVADGLALKAGDIEKLRQYYLN